MIEILKFISSVVPVLVFLITLIYFDSFKLVKFKEILFSLLLGGLIALACLVLNIWLMNQVLGSREMYIRYGSPIIEETIKGLYILFLITKRRVGFLVDAAIFGFAIGTGFAVIENIYYIFSLSHTNPLLWVLRGFGTAVMHGSTTTILAIIYKNLVDRYGEEKLKYFIPALVLAVVIHSVFNHFFINPLLTTLLQLLIFPFLSYVVFNYSDKKIRDWLELNLDTDITMLEYIKNGTVSNTKIGMYLQLLKDNFSGLVVADMLCYLRLHLELGIRAKGILLLRQSGFPVKVDTGIKESIAELKFLEKSIGKTGILALSPVLSSSVHDFWQTYLLEKG
jgi:RsiW-degrading membrane proteinase PrsW (M82 family)